MRKLPFESGTCCLPCAKGITYIKVGSQQRNVGMQKLEIIFQKLFEANNLPDVTSDETFINMARKFNYISRNPSTESDYAQALRLAYSAYYFQQTKA